MDIPLEYVAPEIMAIGDSIYNGVRALSINADKASESPPFFVAQALDVPFRRAEYPPLFLYDLETMIYGGILDDLIMLAGQVMDRAEALMAVPRWSDKLTFDNIANGGATIESLYTDTFESRYKDAGETLKRMRAAGGIAALKHLGDLWYALNAAFLLNPSKSTDQKVQRRTFVDWVGVRKPKRLIINIGSNEGLFRSCFQGVMSDEIVASIESIPEKVTELASHLHPMISDTQGIYYNHLVRPRSVPNIGPLTDYSETISCSTYYSKYYPRLVPSGDYISSKKMKEFDEVILWVSKEVEGKLRAKFGNKIQFVDLYEVSSRYDAKHNCFPGGVSVKHGSKQYRLTNYPLTGMTGFVRGGLGSLDNMHPSVVGYGLIAQAVLDKICQVEELPGRTIDLQSLYESDEILQKFPVGLDLTKGLISFAAALASLFKIKVPNAGIGA
jgi:hypothetical protein